MRRLIQRRLCQTNNYGGSFRFWITKAISIRRSSGRFESIRYVRDMDINGLFDGIMKDTGRCPENEGEGCGEFRGQKRSGGMTNFPKRE